MKTRVSYWNISHSAWCHLSWCDHFFLDVIWKLCFSTCLTAGLFLFLSWLWWSTSMYYCYYSNTVIECSGKNLFILNYIYLFVSSLNLAKTLFKSECLNIALEDAFLQKALELYYEQIVCAEGLVWRIFFLKWTTSLKYLHAAINKNY